MAAKLDKLVIEAIQSALDAGYDVEVRRNKYGYTVASVGKKVIYKGQPTPEREGEKETK